MRVEAQDPPAIHPLEETYIFEADDGRPRQGWVSAPPEASRPAPVLVIFHGLAGPTRSSDKPVMPDLVDELISHGVGVVRFLPRIVELPREQAATIDWEAELDDFAGALRLAQRQDWVDLDEVYILGMSLGGMAAPVVAGRVGGVTGLASWGSSARPWHKYGVINFRAQLEFAGYRPASIKRWSALKKRWLTLLRDTEMTTEEILEDTPDITRLGISSSGHHERSHVFWRQIVRFDPVESYQGLSCRVLAIRGEADCCSHNEDIESIVTAANAAGLEATTAYIPGIDHALKPAASPAASFKGEVGEEAEPRTLARCVAQWIRRENRIA